MAIEGRKNLRQFQCGDALWSKVRRMAAEQDKGVDDLIVDALSAYAQLAGYQSDVSLEDSGDGPDTPPPVRRAAPPVRPAAPPPPPPMPPVPGARYGRPIPSPGGGLNALMQPS